MGLDSVELVMEFEDEFEVEIPDSDAEKMLAVGDVVRFIAARKDFSADDEAGILDIRRRLSLIVSKQMGIKFALLSDETRFVEDLNVD